MIPKLLELHFSQLQFEWNNSKYNSYSDNRKHEYHERLSRIIEKLEKEDFNSLNVSEITQRWYVIFFVTKSLEFLNNSTTSQIPFEIVAVLEKALNDWSSTDEYIIVTSLVNSMNGFSFDNSLMFFEFIYKDIELLYNEKFDKKLVQINVPLITSRDYLASVVLYHELGHFIDRKFEITRVIYIELLDAIINKSIDSAELVEIFKYFPYLADANTVGYFKHNYAPFNLLAAHIAEYFCDLFACQYVGICLNQYLEYITLKQKDYSATHPSTINRVDFVTQFLNTTGNKFLDRVKSTTLNITKKPIINRYKEITTDNFYKLIPYDAKSAEELHGLFTYGWKVWMNDWKEIEQKADLKFTIQSIRVYEIINNLIEKSIGNFIVQEEWKKVNHSL